MNNEATIARARNLIDEVSTAGSQTHSIMLTGRARAWIECLHTENLIDQGVFRDLSIELNAQIDQAVTRFPGQRPTGE